MLKTNPFCDSSSVSYYVPYNLFISMYAGMCAIHKHWQGVVVSINHQNYFNPVKYKLNILGT